MLRKTVPFAGLLLLAGAVFAVTPTSAWAHGGHGGGFGGSHFGGAQFGGAHFGGYHGGFYHGGYRGGFGGYRPYYGYGRGAYGLYPYSSGFYPYSGYDDYPYSATSSDPWWDGDGDNVAPSSLGDTTAVTPPVTGYQSFYSPAAEADDTARVTVNVPPGAEVWFNGTPTTSTGPARQFASPPLTPGTRYSYDIRATWNENGREVTQTRKVEVTAGAHVNVDFPMPPEAAVTGN